MSDAAPSGAVRAAHANGFSRTPTGLSAEARSAEWSCIKRDGSTVPFDAAKIKAALRQCFHSIDLEAPEQAILTHADALVEAVVNILAHKKQFRPDVEEIQRLVIQQLWAANLFDAAEHYQNYRETRRRERAEAPVDPALVATFRAGMASFNGPNAVLQQIQAIDKFARFQEPLGRREVWSETGDRTMDFFQRHVAARYPDSVSEAQWAEARADLLELKSSPSMRTVQMAGPALDRCHVGVYNCLTEETPFITAYGVRTFADYADGETVRVLTHAGRWRDAVVRTYGRQRVNSITFQRGRTLHTYRATANHRWFLAGGLVTSELQEGDRLQGPPTPFAAWSYDAAEPDEKLFWAYGLTFGDGTLVKKNGEYRYSMVRLCGEKGRFLERFQELGFAHSYPPSNEGEPVVYTGTYLKRLPSLEVDGLRKVRAFVAGWLDADGGINTNWASGSPNRFASIQVTGEEAVAFVRNVFPVVGVYINGEDDLTGQVTNFGKRTEVTIKFSLLQALGASADQSTFRVLTIEEDPTPEQVWCLEVDEDQSFVLPSGVVTGNCAFLDMTGPRALAEDLYCLMQGTGVGFSVEYQHAIDKWPRVRKPRSGAAVRTLTVEDTTEGWCNTVVEAVETFLDGGDVRLDTAGVRPAGAVLRTKGGRASGPQPLIDLIDHCRVVIQARGGDRLTSLDVHGMTCMLHRIGQMGGVRRASGISFSDLDDLQMRHAKAGPFWKTAPHLDQANNTAVYDDKPTAVEFMEEWLALAKSGTGERGIFNAGGLARQLPKRRKRKRMRGNPCGEIYLRDRQFCNLSIAVLRPDTPWEELRRRVRMATFWGTLQSTMTKFGYLSDEWRKNCEEERLLGVDLLGHLDHELLGPGKPGRAVLLQQLLGECAAANQHWADTWGIPHSAALTCGKPAGDSSCFFDTSANFKPHHGAHWIRRLRFADHNPVAKVLKAAGVPHQVDYNNTGLLVFEVPCVAPEGGVLLGQQTAVEQLENWLVFKENFTEHNPSISVYVKEDEWLATGHWVYDHWDAVGGLSFFPYLGGKYPLAPYETISADEYRQRKDAFPAIDWSQITRYESEDMTTLSRQFACSSPDGCEI